MFLKLLKYDMRSVWRIWWIMAVSVLGTSVLGAIGLRMIIDLVEADRFPFLIFLCALLVIGCVLAMVASAVITEILIYVRFYKNFFTDEGYLTFTLPVSRKELLLSKTVNALIWTAAEVVLILLGVFFILLIGIPMGEGLGAIRELFYMLSMVWAGVGAWTILYALECLILVLFAGLFSISLVHFCITMGAMLAKKAKIVAAIGVYYVVNMAISFVSQIVALLVSMTMGAGIYDILSSASPAMQGGIVAVMLLIGCAMMAALSCVMYFTTLGKLERNLNLA